MLLSCIVLLFTTVGSGVISTASIVGVCSATFCSGLGSDTDSEYDCCGSILGLTVGCGFALGVVTVLLVSIDIG